MGTGNNVYVGGQADEFLARRRAETCARLAARERELASLARLEAAAELHLEHAARLKELARVHDGAADHHEEAATYYRGLADRIAIR